ncbi:MAG: SRPBCC family protein [Candidatus Promineifilaceae bacterium]
MKLEGSYLFSAPKDAVWRALLDPEVLGKTLPGCQGLEQVGEHDYRATLKIKVGPVQGVFAGTVALSDIRPLEGYRIQVEGKGAPGFVNGQGDLFLDGVSGETRLNYSGDVQVGGRLASVGQRLMESSAQALIRQSLETFDELVRARLEPPAAGEAGQQVRPPGELQFAAGVAGKMLADLWQGDERDQLLRLAAAAFGLLLLLRLFTNWQADRVARQVARRLERRGR